MHWTQTEEGRAKLRAGHKRRKHVKKEQSDPATLQHIAYAFGHVEAWLDAYGRASGVPGPALTGGVAELLRQQARRSVLGTLDHVSGVRSKATS